MMKFIFIAMAATVAFSGAAHAEGVRVEVHGGYDDVRQPPFGPNDSKSFAGVSYGIGIGYDYAVNDKLFIGIEGNVDGSTADNANCPVMPSFFARVCTKLGRDLNANVRLGSAIGDGKTKIYGLAGYSNLRVRFQSQGDALPAPVGTISANADGIRAGVGLERNFGSRAYGKIEYRYSNYEGGFSRNQGIVGFGIRF
jgi:outer membrane immunogenic protein